MVEYQQSVHDKIASMEMMQSLLLITSVATTCHAVHDTCRSYAVLMAQLMLCLYNHYTIFDIFIIYI